MIKISDFVDALGRAEIAKATGVGLTAVSNAVVGGKFPSSWYAAIKNLAEHRGMECPEGLFKMRFGPASQYVDSEKVNGTKSQTGDVA